MFDVSSSDCLQHCIHETFHFAIGLWPQWGYAAVLETKVLAETTKIFTLKCWALSVRTVSGMPCFEKMLSSFGTTVFADVDPMIYTSGKQL